MQATPSEDQSSHDLPLEQHNEKSLCYDEAPAKDEAALSANPDIVYDSYEYPTGFTLAIMMIGLCLSVLLVAIDNTIIVTAIPTITDQFDSLNDIGWYASAYLLTTCALQLLYGKLYTIFSIKFVFLTAISIFEVGSLICGAAQNSMTLIVGRAVAGVGAAGIFSGALIIIAHNVPLEKRPIYTGLSLGMYGIASVIGPLLGGALTDKVSWRWCFYINLPIGGAVLVLIGLFLKTPPQQHNQAMTLAARFMQVDPIGTILFIPAVVCLLLALQLGGTRYAWPNARIIVLFVLFGLLFMAFVGVQIWMGEMATVPPRILIKRSISAAVWYGFFLGGSFFIVMYYLPEWFQAVEGTSATESGIRILPFSFAQMVGVAVSAGLTTRFGYYTPFMFLGTAIMAAGAGLLMRLKVDSSMGVWIGYQIVYGIGSGLGFQQPTIAAQTVLDLSDVPVGVAIAMFTQLLGGTLFVSVGQNVFTNKLIVNLADTLPNISAQAVVSSGASNLQKLVQPSDLPALLTAYNGGLAQTFMVSLILSCLTIVGAVSMEWKSIKGRKLDVMV